MGVDCEMWWRIPQQRVSASENGVRWFVVRFQVFSVTGAPMPAHHNSHCHGHQDPLQAVGSALPLAANSQSRSCSIGIIGSPFSYNSSPSSRLHDNLSISICPQYLSAVRGQCSLGLGVMLKNIGLVASQKNCNAASMSGIRLLEPSWSSCASTTYQLSCHISLPEHLDIPANTNTMAG